MPPDGGSLEPDAIADGCYYMETADDQDYSHACYCALLCHRPASPLPLQIRPRGCYCVRLPRVVALPHRAPCSLTACRCPAATALALPCSPLHLSSVPPTLPCDARFASPLPRARPHSPAGCCYCTCSACSVASPTPAATPPAAPPATPAPSAAAPLAAACSPRRHSAPAQPLPRVAPLAYSARPACAGAALQRHRPPPVPPHHPPPLPPWPAPSRPSGWAPRCPGGFARTRLRSAKAGAR
nr:atherin-like [Aegilops tauschii subsp. strangulata]